MRKIERQMNAAIRLSKNWSNTNTTVHFNEEDETSNVYLHGNLIAVIGDTFIQLFDGGYQSVTTKSRLNAILAENGNGGDCVFQKNFDWFFRSTDTPFFSGMMLT